MKKCKSLQEARNDYNKRIARKHNRFRRCSNCIHDDGYRGEYTKCMVKDKLCYKIEALWCKYYIKRKVGNE